MVAATVRWMSGQLTENGQLLIPGFGRFEVSKKMEYVRCDTNSGKRFLMPPSLKADFVPAPLLPLTEESAANVFDTISETLVSEEKAGKYVAERFPVTFFKGILDAMERGETVTVPQLGAFLLTKVRVAENVFGKVSFTPDAVLSEWVNRPFSYLPEVELNEGVEFDDIDTVTPYDSANEPTEVDNTFLILSEPKVDDTAEEEDQTAGQAQEKTSSEEAPASEETVAEEAPTSEETAAEEAPASEAISSEVELVSEETDTAQEMPGSEEESFAKELPSHDTSSSHKGFWMFALPLLALVIGLISLLLHLRHQDGAVAQHEQLTDTVETVQATVVAETAPPADSLDFEAMNAQIPYGAYDIVGIDTVITVMPGQDLAAISRIFLGTDIHIYLVVANGGNNDPKEGEKYRIPRLRLRK